MPAIITGDYIDDAVQNLKAAMETQREAWQVKEIHGYAAYEVGALGPAIAIDVQGWQPVLVGVSKPTVEVDHKVSLRVWYATIDARADVAFRDIYRKLSRMVKYLIENPRPNGYGELLIDDQAFGPTVQAITGIETSSGPLIAGRFDLVHTFSAVHTQVGT